MSRDTWPTPWECWLIVWPVVLMWIGLLGFAAYTDTHLPDGRGYDMLTVAMLVTTQFLIVRVNLWLMHGYERFTVALSAFLSVKNLYWFWVMGYWLWPVYMTEHMNWLIRSAGSEKRKRKGLSHV
jgi:hypothetical protein